MLVKCWVGMMGYEGPELVPVLVKCSRKQYEDGEHYEAARDFAGDHYGMDDGDFAVDENDPAFGRIIEKSEEWWQTKVPVTSI